MAFKYEIVQIAADTGGGTQDITISGFGTVEAYLIFVNVGLVNATAVNELNVSVGAWSGASENWAASFTSEHNQSSTDENKGADVDAVVYVRNEGTTSVLARATHNGLVTDGIQLSWSTTPSAAYLMTVVFFQGGDFRAGNQTLDVTEGNHIDVTAPGFPMQFMVGLTQNLNAGTDSSNSLRYSIGLAIDDGAITQNGIIHYGTNNAADDNAGVRYTTNRIGGTGNSSGCQSVSVEIGANANGFSASTRDGTWSGSTDIYYFVGACAPNVSLDRVTTATAAGSEAVTAPSFLPQGLLGIGTHLPSVDNGVTASENGTLGWFAADASRAYTTAYQREDGAATTNTQSISACQALLLPTHTGGTGLDVDTLAFNASGWTWDYNQVIDPVGNLMVLSLGGQVTTTGSQSHDTDLVVQRTETQTHVTDLVFGLTSTQTHVADLVIEREAATQTHVTDAVLERQAATQTQIADLVLERTATQTHVTDVVLSQAARTQTHVTDMVLERQAATQTHVTDLIVTLTATQTHVADLVIEREAASQTHVADLVLQRQAASQTHVTDLVLQRTETQTHVTDAVLSQAARTQTHVTDLVFALAASQTHVTDAILLRTETQTHVTDAVLEREAATQTHVTDAVLQRTETQTHVTDLVLLRVPTQTHVTDAVLSQAGRTQTHATWFFAVAGMTLVQSVTVILKREAATQTHVTDLVFGLTSTQTQVTDAILQRTATQTQVTDAVLSQAGRTQTHVANIVIEREAATQTHVTDAVLSQAGRTQTHVADAILQREAATQTHVTDTKLVVVTAGSQTHLTDVRLLLTGSQTHGTDMVLLKTFLPQIENLEGEIVIPRVSLEGDISTETVLQGQVL